MLLTADSRGKKTTITMKISIKLVFTIIFYFSFCISSSLPQGTICPTYVNIPGSQPKTPTTQESSDCRSACLNTANCNGFSQQSPCQLNVGNANDIIYNATATVNYTVILRTNCSTGQNCSWTARKSTYGNGGNKNAMTTINSCLMSCQNDISCTGLDWDSNQKSCYIFNKSGYATASTDVVHHFDKNCLTASTANSAGTAQTPVVTSSGTTLLPSSASSSIASGSGQPTPVWPPTSTTASPCSTPCSGGRCDPAGFCVCNSVCPIGGTQVCGSDSVTYENECIFDMVRCQVGSNATLKSQNACPPVENWNPMAIKPAYIVLAGIGGGCLLLVLTAVIILCEYSMNDETFTHGVVKSSTPAAAKQQQQVQVEQIDIAVVDGENVEFNPYYNRSEIDAPDFTKEENLM